MSADVHSSLLPRGTPIPKLPRGLTQAQERDLARREEQAQLEAAWRIVDARDGWRCRICNRSAVPGAVARKDRGERHHIIPRSRGGPHESWNLILVCKKDHDAIHKLGILDVSGNADERKASGRLCGVLVRKVVGGVWRVLGWR